MVKTQGECLFFFGCSKLSTIKQNIEQITIRLTRQADDRDAYEQFFIRNVKSRFFDLPIPELVEQHAKDRIIR